MYSTFNILHNQMVFWASATFVSAIPYISNDASSVSRLNITPIVDSVKQRWITFQEYQDALFVVFSPWRAWQQLWWLTDDWRKSAVWTRPQH